MYYLLVAIGLVAIGVGWAKRRDDAPWGQPTMIGGAVLVIAVSLWSTLAGGDAADDSAEFLRTQTMRLPALAGEKIGRHVAEARPGQRVLVIRPMPFGHRPGGAEAMLDGLRRGLGDAVTVVAEVDPPLPDGYADLDPQRYDSDVLDQLPPQREAFTAEALDRIAADHPDAQVIVSLAGLPMRPRTSRALTESELYVVVYTRRRAIAERAVAEGVAHVAVSAHGKATVALDDLPDDFEQAFAAQYVMIGAD